MNLFLPQTGGHPLQLDDLILMQNAYVESLSAMVSYLSPTGNTIISGVTINTSGPNITYTNGFVAINGEIFKVVAGSFANSGNPADQIYFLPQQTAVAPSPDIYEDQGSKNVHFQRRVILKYYNSGTDTNGALLVNMVRADAGNIVDWLPPTGTIMSDFFDNTGLGINMKLGWALCNGLNGTPDYRGFLTASATNVPASGASPLNAVLSSITNNPGDTAGFNKQSLVQANLPNVNLVVNDPGHAHGISGSDTTSFSGGGAVPAVSPAGTEAAGNTNSATTGITVSTGGSGQALDFRQPVKYVYKIMKLN